MTPEAERELLEFLEEEKRRRTIRPPPVANAPEFKALHVAIANVADNLGKLILDLRKAEAKAVRRFERHHERISALERPGRPPMPSMSADDSGSIDISGLGGSVKLRGPLPVRAAIAIALALLLVAGGWVAHTAIASATPPQQSAGQVPTHGVTP